MRVSAPLDLSAELRKISLFAELPRHQFNELTAKAQIVRVDRDRPIVAEGDALTNSSFVLQGLVKVTMGRILVDVFRAPTLLVPSSTIDGSPSPVAVVAMRTCDVATIDRASLLSAVFSNAPSAQRIGEMAARESRGYLRRFPELVGGAVEERIAALLDRLAERHGSPLDDGRYMALPLRRCDLAMMVHATTETVSRTLAEWERRGWLRSNRAGLWWASRRVREAQQPSAGAPPARPASDRPEI